MNSLEFTSNLITRLYWPLIVGGALVLFRNPVRELLGRIKSYEGLGQKLEFGEQLAGAEKSVEEAAQSVILSEDSEQQAPLEPDPLVREAEGNPSFVVLQSWEQLSIALGDLAHAANLGTKIRFNPIFYTSEMRKRNLVNDQFVKAVYELRHLRNRVAHGQHNPTPGEAVAYTESAQVLASVARAMADFTTRNA
jgi:hypothetical protein